MKSSRNVGCLSVGLVGVLVIMMFGFIGFATLLGSGGGYGYTPEQEQWLEDNQSREVQQNAPLFNRYLGYEIGDESDKMGLLGPLPGDVAAQAVTIGASESHVTADMGVRYKEREGVTVTAYDLKFVATYIIANSDTQQQAVLEMNFPFPQTAAVLSEVSFMVDGSEPPAVAYSMQGIVWRAVLDPGQERKVEVSYRAEGVGSFGYGVPSSQRIRDFDLQVTIHGAQEVNIPDEALEPTERKDENGATALTWRYRDVITNRSVKVELPAPQSLAFAQRVEKLSEFFILLALAAPVLTVLFLACLWIVARLESLRLGLEHTVLLGIGFFMFYPLFIFSAGFIDLPLAFVVALIVTGALIIGYSVRVLNRQLAAIYLVPLLIVFYGLLTRGLTAQRFLDFGMMVVASSVLLVALFMWRFSLKRQPATPIPPEARPVEAAPVAVAQPAPTTKAVEEKPAPPKKPERFCIHCGQPTEPGFKFCPQCGEDAQSTRKCKKCGLEYIPGEEAPNFCPACGEKQ